MQRSNDKSVNETVAIQDGSPEKTPKSANETKIPVCIAQYKTIVFGFRLIINVIFLIAIPLILMLFFQFINNSNFLRLRQVV